MWKGVVSMVAAAMMCICLVACGGDAGQSHEGQVQPPISSSKAGDKNYQDIVLQFEKAGFTNVSSEGTGDLITGWLHGEGDVDEVSIDGKTNYKTSDWLDADAKVVVRYHSYPSASPSSGSAASASEQSSSAGSTDTAVVANEANAQSSEQEGESGLVSPDVKEMLDSYEAFVDEYIAFMERYKESNNAASMMGEYATYMQKYSDLMEKIDAMDESAMTPVDEAYYIEVTARVSQKLLNASI